jgi:radical SAM protein with 4Fe4S-binding SPASM domain
MTPGKELSPEVYGRLPKSLDDINITGGEPFLRNDILKILDVIFREVKPSRVVISTNGYLSDLIERITKEILKKNYSDRVTIAVSIDGIGKIHDEIRGIPGAFGMVKDTVSRLKKIGFKNIGAGFTFMAGNESQYEKVAEFCRAEGVNLGITVAHNSDNYFSTDSNQGTEKAEIEKQLKGEISRKIKSFKPAELGKCYYMRGMVYYVNIGRALLPCDALCGSFFMDPEGNIYPCNILSDKAGNLSGQSFQEIWEGEKAKKIRMKVKKCPTPCWMVCTAKPAIKKHWFRAGMWIAKEKIKHITHNT